VRTALRGRFNEGDDVIHVIEKGADPDKPLVQFPSFAKAAKWLVECADMFGTQFEVWHVRCYKTKPNKIELETEYEVLP
jgi:hypothetical protein